MKIKGLLDEDFVNYKLVSMFIALGTCDWKCCKEVNIPITICQNSELAKQKDVDISVDEIFYRYTSNPLSQAVVIGGLEPFTQIYDVINLIDYFRNQNCKDPFVIYTGYELNEISEYVNKLKQYENIILKTGRFIPNGKEHYDNILGITLVSENQKGVILSCVKNN